MTYVLFFAHRDEHYLVKTLTEEEIRDIDVTPEELASYENTFMELDMDCSGSLGIDEMKMLMVMLGETFDKDELQEVLEKYDSDHSGELEFNEFVIMMKGWTKQFGTGLEKLYNTAVKRGAIGRAGREFNKWWNQVFIFANTLFLCYLCNKGLKSSKHRRTLTNKRSRRVKRRNGPQRISVGSRYYSMWIPSG